MAMKWRVQNDTSVNLCIGSFGIQNNMQARMQVPANQTRELRDHNGNLLQLTDGDRMFVAWDDFTDQIKVSAGLRVDSSLGTSITVLVTDTGMDVSYA